MDTGSQVMKGERPVQSADKSPQPERKIHLNNALLKRSSSNLMGPHLALQLQSHILSLPTFHAAPEGAS